MQRWSWTYDNAMNLPSSRRKRALRFMTVYDERHEEASRTGKPWSWRIDDVERVWHGDLISEGTELDDDEDDGG